MAALAKVQARGQVTLPRDVRQAVGIQPSDTLMIQATGPSSLQVTVLPRLTHAEALLRYRVEGEVDMAALRREADEDAAADALRDLNA